MVADRPKFNIQAFPKKKQKTEDDQILEWLKPLSEKLELSLSELALNLEAQEIFKFDDVENLTSSEYY